MNGMTLYLWLMLGWLTLSYCLVKLGGRVDAATRATAARAAVGIRRASALIGARVSVEVHDALA